MKMRILAVGALGVVMALAACTGQQSAQDKENSQQGKISKTIVQNQPLPAFSFSQMRQNLIEIETAEAQGVQTTSFFFNLGVQDPTDSCPSIGVPIPNTASLSNPQQVVSSGGSDGVVVAQMDPNGVYAPAASEGTFVLCVDARGNVYANYWEGPVKTVFGPAVWDKSSHTVELTGPPSFKFSGKK